VNFSGLSEFSKCTFEEIGGQKQPAAAAPDLSRSVATSGRRESSQHRVELGVFHLKLTYPSQFRHRLSVTMWLLLLPKRAGERGEISEDIFVHSCFRFSHFGASLSARCEDVGQFR
jgi:hypothetical protein